MLPTQCWNDYSLQLCKVRYILQQKQSNIGYYKTNINYTSEIYYHPHESANYMKLTAKW